MCRRTFIAAAVASLVLSATGGSSAAPPAGWARLDHPALAGGVHISYVSDVLPPSEGHGWLAGGWVVDPDGIRSPSIWSSRDGASWTRTVLPATQSSERRDGVYHIARRDDVTVALGDRFVGGVRLAAWRGSGRRWTALTDETSPVLSYSGRIVDVTSSRDAFVAVGSPDTSRGARPQVFRSADGESWSVHSTIPAPAGEAFGPSEVIAVGEKLVVAGEAAAGSAREGRIMIWDGASWTRVDPQASGMTGLRRIQVAAVAYHPRIGFVAGGLAQRGELEQPAAWFSRDGAEWARLPDHAVPSAAGGAAIHMIVTAGTRFLAAGNSPSGPVLWESTDGRRWTLLDTPKKAHTASWANVTIAATASTTVLALAGDGAADAYRRGPSGSWSVIDKAPAFPGAKGGPAELRGVAASAGRLVAVGRDAKGQALILTSRDARSWTRVRLPDPRARLQAVAANGGLFAIAGWRLVEGRAHVALWTSRTGRQWRRLGGTRFDTVGAFVDLEPDGRRFAVAAFEGSSRGLRASSWSADARALEPGAILGSGETRGICVGPGGATLVAVRGQGRSEQIVAWTRGRSGRWNREAQLVATGAEANGCAGGPEDTLIVGSATPRSSASAWRRKGPGGTWERTDFAVTQLPSSLFAATRAGTRFVVTGQVGTRGQIDLALWSSGPRSWGLVGGSSNVFAEPGYQAGLAVVPFRGRFVVVGRRGSGSGAIWVGPATYPLESGAAAPSPIGP